jgi:hypothetical protein
MEHMRRIAFETVMRACSFASLAIFCVMVGMSFNPRMAFQAGGFLTTLMSLVLIIKAYEARTKPYRRTEMWLYLPKVTRSGRAPPCCVRPTSPSRAGPLRSRSRCGCSRSYSRSSARSGAPRRGRRAMRPMANSPSN